MPELPIEDLALSEFIAIQDHRLPAIANDDDILNLSEADQTVLLIVYFDGEVLNGGLLHWLINQTGGFVHETLHALERVGAAGTAGIVRSVVEVFGEPISRNCSLRNRWRCPSTQEPRGLRRRAHHCNA